MKKSPGTIRKLLTFVGAYKVLLILSILISAFVVVLQLYVPILFGHCVDFLIGKGKVDFEGLNHKLIWILILIGVSGIGTWIMNVINNRMTFGIVRAIRSKAIRKIQTLPLAYLDRKGVGDIASRVITDTDQLSDGLLLGFTQLVAGIVTIGVTLYFMFRMNI